MSPEEALENLVHMEQTDEPQAISEEVVNEMKEAFRNSNNVDAMERLLDRHIMQIQQQNMQLQQLRTNNSIEGSHVNSKRGEAIAVETNSFRLEELELTEEILLQPSALLANFRDKNNNGDRVRTYGNEADIQEIVHSALNDAVAIINASINSDTVLVARKETGLFSNRPDHEVVTFGNEAMSCPVLVAESKEPIEGQVSNHVWGQVYDYLGILRVRGHCNPFVLLSTFDQSWLAWMESNESCGTIASANSSEERFSFLEDWQCRSGPSTVNKSPVTHKTEEPEQVSQGSAPKRAKLETEERCLAVSSVFSSNLLVRLLVNAIACNLRNFSGTPAVRRGPRGYELKNRPVLTLSEKSYEFQKISIAVYPAKDPAKAVRQNAMKFHILDVLGSGRTSKAFLAVTESGAECVLKMYTRKFDEGDNYRRIDKNTFENNARESTNREKNRYKTIYGWDIKIVTLVEHKCLVLPYVRPVQANERLESLNELKELLESKFRVNGGRNKKEVTYFEFEECDQVWRHCGYVQENGKERFVVFDLADLQMIKPGKKEHNSYTADNHDSYIRRHCERLEQKANEGSQADTQ